MNRRPGLSLTEVLVALFIMALGTVAILTLFPLGAYNLGQALKDDRTAQSAIQADAYMRAYWKAFVVESIQAQSATGAGVVAPDFSAAFTNPNADNSVFNTVTQTIVSNSVPFTSPTLPIATAGQPSYPVFVDPYGDLAPWGNPTGTSDQKYWVAGMAQAIPRRMLSQLPSRPSPTMTLAPSPPIGSVNQAVRVSSMLDGLSFGPGSNGIPIPFGSTSVDRDYRYNWLWVLQQPDAGQPSLATMTVVVFDRRPFQFVMNNAETAFTGTATNPISFNPGSTVISVPTALGVPNVQKGGWVMDAGIAGTLRQAYFYRVVSVTTNTNNPTNPTTDIELQLPIHRVDGSSSSYAGTLVVLNGVSEVFDRPMLTSQ